MNVVVSTFFNISTGFEGLGTALDTASSQAVCVVIICMMHVYCFYSYFYSACASIYAWHCLLHKMTFFFNKYLTWCCVLYWSLYTMAVSTGGWCIYVAMMVDKAGSQVSAQLHWLCLWWVWESPRSFLRVPRLLWLHCLHRLHQDILHSGRWHYSSWLHRQRRVWRRRRLDRWVLHGDWADARELASS